MSKKQILTIIIPSLSVLAAGIIFVVIAAIIGKWDVWGWMTSSQAILIYALLLFAAILTPLVIVYYKTWKEKQQ